MHQTGVVAGSAHLCACVEDVAGLLGKHGARYICVLDGEGTTEAAALFYIGKLDKIDAADCFEKPERTIAQLQTEKTVAARVVSDTMRVVGSNIFEPKFFREELGELPYAGEDAVDLFNK